MSKKKIINENRLKVLDDTVQNLVARDLCFPSLRYLNDYFRINCVFSFAQLGESFVRFSAICGENPRRVHRAVLLF
jgi:hypothetical protein